MILDFYQLGLYIQPNYKKMCEITHLDAELIAETGKPISRLNNNNTLIFYK